MSHAMGENRLRLHAEGGPKGHPFVYDSVNPDIWQARQSAYEGHGRLWSPHLYCYASLGCRIADEDFREGLIKEITFAMETVEANPALYESNEPARLGNLRRCVEVAKANGPGGRKQTIEKTERRRGPEVESVPLQGNQKTNVEEAEEWRMI